MFPQQKPHFGSIRPLGHLALYWHVSYMNLIESIFTG